MDSDRLTELNEKAEALDAKAKEIVEKSETANSEELDGLKAQLAEIKEELAPLQEARKDAERDHERDELKGQITTLTGAIEKLREPDGFSAGPAEAVSDEANETYNPDSEYSFYKDLADAGRGDRKAQDRLSSLETEGKAMTEGTGSAGGFLVPDAISSELLALRAQNAVLRPLFSSVGVQSDTLRIASVTGGLTAGWVDELAAKPSADLTFAEISTNVFTAAGLAVASNQLLADSVHSVDSIVNQDLAKRLRNLEEVAFINGTGTGQPKGIIGTTSVGATTYTSGSPTPALLLDAIYDAITAVHTDFLDAPNAIVLHPRTWAYLAKARESAAPTTYILGAPGSNPIGRRPQDPIPGRQGGQTPRGTLFGLDVYTTANIPTNLGGGTNESRVIVGDFSQGLILDRQGITLDKSEHVYFTTNQTVFRAEERLGFTAARYPKAFNVIGGTGLLNL